MQIGLAMSHFVNSGSKWIQVVDRQLKNDSSSPSTSKRIGSSMQLPREDQPPHVCHYATAILAAFEQIYPFDGCYLFPSVSAIGPSSKWANHTAIITKWANHPGLFWPGLKETGQAIHSPATGSTTAEDIVKGMEGGSLLSRWRERAEREQCWCVKCSAPFRGIAGGSMYVTVSTLRAVWSGFFCEQFDFDHLCSFHAIVWSTFIVFVFISLDDFCYTSFFRTKHMLHWPWLIIKTASWNQPFEPISWGLSDALWPVPVSDWNEKEISN